MPEVGFRQRAELEAGIGIGIRQFDRVPWGDSRAVHRVRLADGRDLAARWLPGPDAPVIARRLIRHASVLARAHIDVPWPMQTYPTSDGSWLVMPWISGRVGASLLDDLDRRRAFARSMGSLARRVSTVDLGLFDLERTWLSAPSVARHAMEIADTHLRDLGWPVVGAIRSDLDLIGAAWRASDVWAAGLAHGDFAPINVVASGGRVTLLDLGTLCIAPRVVDLAWWGWVVRYHHPAVWTATWEDFLTGADVLTTELPVTLAAAVARICLLGRLAGAPDSDRALWLKRVHDTSSW